MPRAIVLGAGMVGSVLAADLAADPSFDVTVADARADALERVALRARGLGRITTIQADLSDAATIRRVVADRDIVLGALASRIALNALRAVIEAGRNYCDISFMAEDPLELDASARDRGVTCVVDCGVAPGMSHMFAGYGAAYFERCETVEIYVGGLPAERRWPYQYKAAFSPADVIEEYTRPARLVEGGRVVVREALSDPELMDFAGVGTLEAFNTDGLRSLVRTLRVPSMKEKTLRYPGHIELMRVLRATGLFSEEPVRVRSAAGTPGAEGHGTDVAVRPRDLIAALMFPMWTYQPGEEDLTVMRVIVEGVRHGRRERLTWDLFDRFDAATQTTSMARTTAFPCAIMARLVASGAFRRPGVVVPEFIGQTPGLLDIVLKEHERRGVRYAAKREALPVP